MKQKYVHQRNHFNRSFISYVFIVLRLPAGILSLSRPEKTPCQSIVASSDNRGKLK